MAMSEQVRLPPELGLLSSHLRRSREPQTRTRIRRALRRQPYGPVRVRRALPALTPRPLAHPAPRSIRGATATEFLEWITPSDLQSLPAYSSTLSVLLNENGGIIDDLMITKHAPDAFYVVTNAGRRERDIAWFQTAIKEWNAKHDPVELEILADWGLLALQGTSEC